MKWLTGDFGPRNLVNYRRLKPPMIRFLESEDEDGAKNWPKYRMLKSYAIRNRYAFSEREYLQLKRVHVAAEGVVEALIQYLHDVQSRLLLNSFPHLPADDPRQWRDEFTEINDGESLRRQDYYRKGTWKELPLLYVISDDHAEAESFCRTEDLARRIAVAQYIEIGRDLVKLKERKCDDLVCAAARTKIGLTVDEFADMFTGWWRVIPECVWITTKRSKPIGGSIIIPLTKDAYERMKSGELSDREMSADDDLEFPSRYLWLVATTSFPEVARPRFPGVHTARQLRKILQHIAVMIGPGDPARTPVHLLAVAGSRALEHAFTRMGFDSLQTTLKKTTGLMFESVIPPPETTISDFSSAAAAFATLIGTSWRSLQQD